MYIGLNCLEEVIIELPFNHQPERSEILRQFEKGRLGYRQMQTNKLIDGEGEQLVRIDGISIDSVRIQKKGFWTQYVVQIKITHDPRFYM